jgi:hypothetical protein
MECRSRNLEAQKLTGHLRKVLEVMEHRHNKFVLYVRPCNFIDFEIFHDFSVLVMEDYARLKLFWHPVLCFLTNYA